MAISGTLFVITIVIVAIWVIIEVKRLKHKIFAILLIALILFSYISAAALFKGKDIDYKTVPGMVTAGKLYFSWLGSVFGNLRHITTSAIDMDWGTNKTEEELEEKSLFG